MGVFNRKDDENGRERAKQARFKVDLALLKMDRVLDVLQDQSEKAKEELRGRNPA